MKISGAELAAQRSAQRKHRALYNYGDLIAYRAAKFVKIQDRPRAYHSSCLLESCKGHHHSSGGIAASLKTASWFFVNFGGTSDRKLPVGSEVQILDHSSGLSEQQDDLNDPSYIDPQFTTGSLEMWRAPSSADLSLNLISEANLPIALVGHSMIPYKAKNKLIVYGGAQLSNRSLFSNIYVVSMKTFEVKQFRLRKGAQPAGRLRHSACLMGDRMFIFGGQCHSSSAICLEDFWCLDLVNYLWKQISPVRVITNGGDSRTQGIETQLEYDRSHGPGKRYGQHMVVYKGIIYVAFGSDGSCVLDDVWGFKDDYWFRVQLLNHAGDPYGNLQGRVDFAAALNEETGIWLLHGGLNAEGEMLNTILEISLETYECRRIRAEVSDEGNICAGKSGGSSTHFATPKSSLSSSNGSNNRLLPALRGHAMIHIPKTNHYVLTRGVNKYNEFTQTEYILTFTEQSYMQLEKGEDQPSSPLADLAPQQYEVTPIFDTTHYWQSNHMPEQPPTLLQTDLRAVDTSSAGNAQNSSTSHKQNAEFDCNPPAHSGGDDEAGGCWDHSPMLIPQRLSAPRKHTNDDDGSDALDSPPSHHSSCEPFRSSATRPTESENSNSPRGSHKNPHVSPSQHGSTPQVRGTSRMDDEWGQSSKCKSIAYWRERCSMVERENLKLRTQLDKMAINLTDQRNTISAVMSLLSRFSLVDIDQ